MTEEEPSNDGDKLSATEFSGLGFPGSMSLEKPQLLTLQRVRDDSRQVTEDALASNLETLHSSGYSEAEIDNTIQFVAFHAPILLPLATNLLSRILKNDVSSTLPLPFEQDVPLSHHDGELLSPHGYDEQHVSLRPTCAILNLGNDLCLCYDLECVYLKLRDVRKRCVVSYPTRDGESKVCSLEYPGPILHTLPAARLEALANGTLEDSDPPLDMLDLSAWIYGAIRFDRDVESVHIPPNLSTDTELLCMAQMFCERHLCALFVAGTQVSPSVVGVNFEDKLFAEIAKPSRIRTVKPYLPFDDGIPLPLGGSHNNTQLRCKTRKRVRAPLCLPEVSPPMPSSILTGDSLIDPLVYGPVVDDERTQHAKAEGLVLDGASFVLLLIGAAWLLDIWLRS